MTASQICLSIQITLLLSHLDGVGVLEQLGELALLALELRVAANVLLADEDVGHRALLGHLLEGILYRGAVVCMSGQRMVVDGEGGVRLTNLVELEDEGLCAALAEEALSGLAVRAVRLGEDSCKSWMVSRVPG